MCWEKRRKRTRGQRGDYRVDEKRPGVYRTKTCEGKKIKNKRESKNCVKRKREDGGQEKRRKGRREKTAGREEEDRGDRDEH